MHTALIMACLFAATGPLDVSRRLMGKGEESAALRPLLAANRHIQIPAGFTVTLGGSVAVPADTTIEGPGGIHLLGRGAGLVLSERCTVRDVRFTCAPEFAHGSAISMATAAPGTVRRMDVRILNCRFEKMRGHALSADEVSHVTFEGNYWENHSPNSLYYNATQLRAVCESRFRANTLLHPNQGLLFRGGWHNVITDNYIENCLQGITCHTVGAHPQHWPYTLFAHNVIANNVIRRLREEGICYDNSMGETPAVNAAQNQVRAVATVKAVAAGDKNHFRITLVEPANPNKSYAPGWADHYFVGILTGQAAATLLEVVASGVDGAAWIDLPRTSADLPARIQPGDRLWIAAGCFANTITGNVLDNAGMVSGGGNGTCIGLWGAAWQNVITSNVCTTRQYGITIGCVGLKPPDSPQGPCAGNTISHNTVRASWSNSTTTTEEEKSAGIGFVYIGDGPLLDGRLFLGNTITHNTLSWPGRRPIRIARDFGTVVAFNRVSDESAAIALDNTTGAILEGNRTAAGTLIERVEKTGPCTFRLVNGGLSSRPSQ